MGERRTHGDAEANEEEVTYETLLWKAKLQSIADMILDISKDPTLLEDFPMKSKAREEEPKTNPQQVDPILPTIQPQETNPFIFCDHGWSFGLS